MNEMLKNISYKILLLISYLSTIYGFLVLINRTNPNEELLFFNILNLGEIISLFGFLILLYHLVKSILSVKIA